MTFHSWGGLLKRTLRSLDFSPGSASFLLPESDEVLVSSLVMGWCWMGNPESEPMVVDLCNHYCCLLSSLVKGWAWMVMVRIYLSVCIKIVGLLIGSFPRGKSFPLQGWLHSHEDGFPFQYHSASCFLCGCAFSDFAGA